MIYIEEKSWNKLLNYSRSAVKQFSAEIGGMALLEQDEDGDWWIVEPTILKQTVTGSNCNLDAEELSKYYTTEAMENPDVRFVWWHSHANMGVFWSGTDTNTMDADKSIDWSVALVINAKGEYKVRVNWESPISFQHDTELGIIRKDIPKYIKNEVKELCSKPETRVYTCKSKKNKHMKAYNPRDNVTQNNLFPKDEDDDFPFHMNSGQGGEIFFWEDWWTEGWEVRYGVTAYSMRSLAKIIQDFYISLDYEELRGNLLELNHRLAYSKYSAKIPKDEIEAIDWFGDCIGEKFNLMDFFIRDDVDDGVIVTDVREKPNVRPTV